MFCLTITSGYNLNGDNLGLLTGDSEQELLGWSLVLHQGSLYVGAPLAGKAGKVYRCDHLETNSLRCSAQRINPEESSLLDGAWFGGTLAASNDTLYSCAFRYNWEHFDDMVRDSLTRKNYWKWHAGKCYQKKTSQTSFQDLVDFTPRYEGRKVKKRFQFPKAGKDDTNKY